jgi:hypothetical protein
MSAPTFIYPPASTGGTPVGGSGTPGTIPVWSTGTTLGDSIIKQSSGATSVGVGVTPLTSLAGYKSIEVGAVGSGFLAGNNDAYVTANAAFYSGGWKYAASAAANAISFTSGITKFLYASAGGAGGALTWVESARIDSSGNVGIGTASPSHRLAVVGGDIFRHNTFTDASNYKGTRLSSATYSGAEYSTLTVVGIGTFAASNIGLVLQPLGTGAITAQMPDGTATGGNARGAQAVDLQTARASAAQVASGAYCITAGQSNTASGTASVAFGSTNTAQGNYSTAAGSNNSATGAFSFAVGAYNTVSSSTGAAIGAYHSVTGLNALATGNAAAAYLRGQHAHATYNFATNGDAQRSTIAPLVQTTTAAATNLTLDGAALAAGNALSLPNNTAWAADVHIVARSATGAGHAYFVRRVLIKRDANQASTALVGTVQTIGTDIGSNAGAPPAGWAVAITADTTNGALDIQATGAAATTIRWVARIDLAEVRLA